MKVGICTKDITGVLKVRWKRDEPLSPLRCHAKTNDVIWEHNGLQWNERLEKEKIRNK